MPDPQAEVELPLEDAAEQELPVVPEFDGESSATTPIDPAGSTLEANEADYAEQQTAVGYDDEDYR